jgi:FtsP/CotA-like multicopper oxidase with cupredoxin domain
MALPAGPLPPPAGMPSVEKMLQTTPNAVRHVAFELCGQAKGTRMETPDGRLPSCGWYIEKYDSPDVWGGAPFHTIEMLRDADDTGTPSNDPNVPLVGFKKEGLFTPDQPLFNDMIAGNYEEWTVLNRSFSDHPFHIHQNHFLVTKINGQTLPTPEWHDTIIVPSVQPQPTDFPPAPPNINKVPPGSITFRIWFSPVSVGCFVMHCHIIAHEDLGMMQRVDVLAGPGQTGQCDTGGVSHEAGNASPLSWLYAMAGLESTPKGPWPICVAP